MASIDSYIEQIQNAVYGEEVRSSIINALEKVNDDNESYQDIKDEVIAAKDEVDKEVANFETLVAGAETAKSDLETAITNAASAQSDLETATSTANTAINSLSSKNNQASSLLSGLNAAITSLEAAQANAETAQSNLEAAQANAETAQSNLEGAINDATTQQSNLEITIDAANTAQTNLTTIITNASTAKTNLQAVIDSAGTAQSSLSTVITEANSAISQLTTLITTSDTSLAELTEQNDIAQQNIGELTNANSNTNEILSSVENIKTYLDDTIASAESAANSAAQASEYATGDTESAKYFYELTLALAAASGVEEAAEVIQSLIAGVTRTITIPTDGWETDIDIYDGVYINIDYDDITESMVPIVAIPPEYMDLAKSCGLSTIAQTIDGAVRLFAKEEPSSEIEATLTLILASTGTVGNSSSSSDSSYTLPAATATTLGGVKIGGGLSVTSDGTLSVDTETLTDDLAADDESVDSALDEIYSTRAD